MIKNLSQMLGDLGIRSEYHNRIIGKTIKVLLKKGFVAADNRITANEDEFAEIVLAQVPKKELARLSREGR